MNAKPQDGSLPLPTGPWFKFWQSNLHRVQELINLQMQFGCAGVFRFLYNNYVSRSPLVKCRVYGIRTPIYYRYNTSDFICIQQAFDVARKKICPRRSPKLIIDGGANAGYMSLYFANAFPDAKIIAIEPEPSNCEIFRMNCDQYPQITLIQGAIWPCHKRLAIANPEADKWGFRVEETRECVGNMSVNAISIEDILSLTEASSIDILKLDIEGSESELFSVKCNKWLPQVRMIVAELHDNIKKGCSSVFFQAISSRPYKCMPIDEYQVVTFVDEDV